MITAEDFFDQFGGYTREEMLETAKEYAREAIKADRINVAKHAVIVCKQADYEGGDLTAQFSVDKETIINAPNIELK